MQSSAALDRSAPLDSPYRGPSPAAGASRRKSVVQQYREIAHEVWAHRELLLQLTLRDVRLRYKQAVMGFGWALLMPVLVVLSGLMIRLAMAHYAGGTLERAEIAGMVVKAAAWAFFAGAVGFATTSLITNMVLLTKVYFAREVLPLSATLAQAFDTLVGTAAVALALAGLGVRPSPALLWVPVLAALLFVFTAAVALFLSCANLFYRDVKYIVQVALTFGIFFTPVLFEPLMLGARGARLLMLNPLSPCLEGLRLSIVNGHNLLTPVVELSRRGEAVLVWSPWYLAYAGLWAVGGLALAASLFHKLEFVFAEYV